MSKEYKNFGDGIFTRKGFLYMRYYDPVAKKGRIKTLDFPNNRDGVRQAKKYREEYLYNLKKQNPFDNLIPVDKYVKLSEGYQLYLNKQKLSSKSKSITQYAINYFISACGDKVISTYGLRDYDEFKFYMDNTRKLSITTQAMYSRHLKAIFRTFQRWKLIQDIPIDKIEGSKKEVKAIPNDDMEALLKQLKTYEKNPHWYDLIYFLYLSGLRIGEAISLTWEMIDLDNNVMTVNNTKGKRIDRVPILEDLKNHLISMNPNRINTGKVFIYTRTDSAYFFYKVQDDLWGKNREGRKYTLHQLRKTFITYLLKCGNSIHDVMVLSRHTDFRIIQNHYNDLSLHLPAIKDNIDKRTEFIKIPEI